MDVESYGEAVHDINTLTVVASESYKGFVTDLQSDIKTVLYDRPTVATREYFKGKYVKVDDIPMLIDGDTANAIEFYLIQNGYVDMKHKVTDQYRQDVKTGTVAELPEELKAMADGIHLLIQSVYDDSILKDMFTGGHETKVKDNPLNENFAKKEFQALWSEINHRYAYTVEFDSDELIKKAIAHIDEKLFVSELQYTTTIGRQKAEMNEYEVERGVSFTGEKTRTQTLKHAETSQIKYDLIGKVAEGTVLTRKTVSAILQGIRADKLYMFKNGLYEAYMNAGLTKSQISEKRTGSLFVRDKISIITDQIEAVPHKHWAMQLFLSVEKNLEISVEGKKISCKCIVINRNILHSFSTGGSLYFTMIIEPTSSFASQLEERIGGKKYYIFDNQDIEYIQSLLFGLIDSDGLREYREFMIQLYKFLRIKEQSKIYDGRIRDLLCEIEQCNCDTHSIASFADKVALSSSRLSHLFKEQVGIPLKSHI